MDLRSPSEQLLPSYIDSLNRGWSSESLRLDDRAAAGELAVVLADPGEFVRLLNHPTRGDTPVTLQDGTQVPRIPGLRRWIWDGSYCGAISLRWQPGTTDLPPNCLGHIGYGVVPWKRRRGYATDALAQMLVIASDQSLPFVDLVTDVENTPSQDVIRANGGVLVEEFTTPASNGSFEAYRYRIHL